MDNITHTLAGVALSRFGPMREHRMAPVMLILASNLPDFDAYGLLFDDFTYLAHHRGYGHALVTAPLLALACVLFCRLWLGIRVTWSTWAFSLMAVLGHDLLDWTNPYGVRWLLPWSGEWFHLNTTMPWDPVILVVLVFTAGMPALLQLLDATMRNVRMQRASSRWAWIALCGVLVYSGARWSSQRLALRMMTVHQYRPPDIEAMDAYPARGLPTKWRGVVTVEGAVYELPLDTTSEFPYLDRFRMKQPDEEYWPLIEAARTTKAAKALEAMDPLVYYAARKTAGSIEVRMIDARFGTLAEPQLQAVMHIGEDGRVISDWLVVDADVY